MSGGFCMYIKQWQYATDPSNPLIAQGAAGTNVTTEPLGISCSVVKATTGPTVKTTWDSTDFRAFWLPLSYKDKLDAGTLDLYDLTDTTLQSYRLDTQTIFRGLKYWRGSLSSSGMLISDKYELLPQTSYTSKNDYRFSYRETVSLYKLSSDTSGKITWTSMKDVELPKQAGSLGMSLAAVALAVFLQF